MDVTTILHRHLTEIISETNGIALNDTIDLMLKSYPLKKHPQAVTALQEFKAKLDLFKIDKMDFHELIAHPFTEALFRFFRAFPVKFNEEHIHLTGSMTAEFLHPRLMPLFTGPNKEVYRKKIKEVYGIDIDSIKTVADVDKLIRLEPSEGFLTYLKILYLPKLVFIDRQAHEDAAYHLAKELYHKYNVGKLRLKFSLSRSTASESEQIPGIDNLTSEDVVLGLYGGFATFKSEHPDFNFVLSPSFRKESHHFDSGKFGTRKDHIHSQIDEIIALIDRYPELQTAMTEIDTVGDERNLYRKEHFNEFREAFRKLQYRGFKIRSHHGETFHTLKKGIQAVDNAMNIWHIDTLEHGVSLGINPNYYFHRIFQEILHRNQTAQPLSKTDRSYQELQEMDWGDNKPVLEKLLNGVKLTKEEVVAFTKAKFHTAREVEHYQHDVLNRLLQKDVTLVSLPSSNNKLTGQFDDYKDHPFSWWEKKGVSLGVGTDNYVTLNTNYIQEMMILLYTDPDDLKITKLLMVASGETRRPYLSHLLWTMRKQILNDQDPRIL
ncbi:MAG: hypothetical protein V4736_01590 [Bdellovibrionota bacterium]